MIASLGENAGSGTTRKWHIGRRLLRWGVRPYVLTVDATVIVAGGLWLHPAEPAFLIVVAAVLGCLRLGGMYRSRLSLSVLDDLPTIMLACLVGVGVDAVLGPHQTSTVATVTAHAQLAATLLAALLIGRTVAYAVVRWARRRGVVRHRVLVLGSGAVGRQLVEVLLDHPEFGLVPVGVLGADRTDVEPPVSWLGTYRDLDELVRRYGVRDLVVAPADSESDAELVSTLRRCERLQCQVFLVPRLQQLVGRSQDVELAWDIPLLRLGHASAFRSSTWHLKRVLDVTVATVCLLAAAPLLAVVALAVRLEGGPGILFRQQRVGLGGRSITVLKFRSMRPADRADEQTTWSIDSDPRVGPVGRFIRRTSLDELPQLWNVIRGDMSLVGPRPERHHFVDLFTAQIPTYHARHRVPVGMTGWAQIHGLRGDTSIEDRVNFDNGYIEAWSLWMDVKILVRTVGHVVATALRRAAPAPENRAHANRAEEPAEPVDQAA